MKKIVGMVNLASWVLGATTREPWVASLGSREVEGARGARLERGAVHGSWRWAVSRCYWPWGVSVGVWRACEHWGRAAGRECG